MIKYDKHTEVNSLSAFADVENFHMDDVLASYEGIGIFYRTLTKELTEGDYYIVKSFTIWDEKKREAWVIYDTNGRVRSDSKEYHNLSKFARKQWKNLCNKRVLERSA